MINDHLTDVLHHVRKLTGTPPAADLTDGELLERFCRAGEETAFALIVQRHGPLVLNVCRRVALDSHDAEDAFQATFLVLVRKARAVRKQSSLASFLFGVAQRIALQARLRAARRRARERERPESPPPDPSDELTARELRHLLDAELTLLPDRYRAPIVLCYLEGKTQEQAAQELGCPRTSLASRLGRALGLLHQRLTRRGVALSAAGLATALAGEVAAAPVPALLTLTAVRTAVQGSVSAGVSAHVAALAREGVPPVLTAKWIAGIALLLLTAALATAGYAFSTRDPAPPAAAEAEKAETTPVLPVSPGTPLPEARVVAGVVVDPAGKPVAGANVWLTTAGVADGSVEVFDQGTTDEQGRFRVTVPARWFATTHALRQELGLIAHKPGRRVAAIGFARSSIPRPTGTRLVLEAPTEASIHVLAPDGNPVAGARVEVRWLACDQIQTDITEEYARDLGNQFRSIVRATPIGFVVRRQAVPIPAELSRRLSARSDAKGTVALPELARTDVGGLAVTAEKFGSQSFLQTEFLAAGKEVLPEFPDSVKLMPAGRVTGQLTAKNGDLVKNLLVQVSSLEDPPSVRGSLHRSGWAEVKTDSEGRFEAAALAAGRLTVRVTLPRDAEVVAREPADRTLKLQAGESTAVEIPLQPGVRVGGVVRERGTGKPLAGVRVHLYHGDKLAIVETDAKGRYTCLVSPGTVSPDPQLQRGFLPRSRDEQRSTMMRVPEGKTEYELPPLDLTRSITFRGTVLGEDDKPVPGALVHAIWWGYNHQFGSDTWLNETSLTTDERGEFQIEGLDSKTELRLKAQHEQAWTPKVVTVRAGAAGPLTLRVSRAGRLALAGRVRDARGGPIPGARIEVWARPWLPEPNVGTPRAVALAMPVRTDTDGKFQTPRQLEPDGFYRVVIRADGFLSESSDWLPVGDARPLAFPDLVLQRSRALQGRVLDRDGKPVAGVRLLYVDGRNRLTAMTDAEGRYRLEGVREAAGFLFAQKDGFRFYGQDSDPKVDRVDVVLARTTEPVARAMKTLPSPLTKKERLGLAARVLEPGLKRILAGGDDEKRLRPLEVLARIDPGRVLEQLDKKAIKNAWIQDYLRRAVAQALLTDSPDEARTVIDAMKDPGFRSIGYCDLADALPTAKRKEKLELLAEALLHGRAIKDASHCVAHLAGVVKRFRDLGEKKRADQLLREYEPAARALPAINWAGYARAVFAEELAMIDLPAALALIKDLKDALEYDRHHGNIAHKLAGIQPAEAERILGMLGKPGRTIEGRGPYTDTHAPDRYAIRVCYRMVAVDPERARRIAERMTHPNEKARAYGVMAQALVGTKPARAVELLHQGFAVLDAHVTSGKDRFNGVSNAAVTGAALLPVAEQLDPHLVPEFVWRTLSLRTPPPRDGNERRFAEAADIDLALMLARYDRALARRLLEPRVGKAAEFLQTGPTRALIPALAAVDPKWAVEVFDGLPDTLKEREGTRLAKAISLGDAERWRKSFGEVGMWFVDDEDL
jgi:RNA polymerase sigma factor (sigma-70 family)